ncbi:uncharacterized protein EI90DRAFT_3014445 [Cantharellus anzutake]|uniref:uncharacterized protein n=1 Tax=Cantharellus anzutake TaxID=1750568 RepID=UPI001906C332|nr:uncharacterized protein EI90DRAFT_3014445 [Cantharellus anzutake]KAF8335827.1 hypothetical protein EI90DRAFT_3014445 [Cantharellus anzutake]
MIQASANKEYETDVVSPSVEDVSEVATNFPRSGDNGLYPSESVLAQGGRVIGKGCSKKGAEAADAPRAPECWGRDVNLAPGGPGRFAPILIKSNSHWLSESFPPVFPDVILTQRDISLDDWYTFLENIQTTATLPPGKHALSLCLPVIKFTSIQGYLISRRIEKYMKKRKLFEVLEVVRMWNEQFFSPRGVKVTLRPDWIRMGDDLNQAFDRKKLRKRYSLTSVPTEVSEAVPVQSPCEMPSTQVDRCGARRTKNSEGTSARADEQGDRVARALEKKARCRSKRNERKHTAGSSWCRVGGKYDLIVEPF